MPRAIGSTSASCPGVLTYRRRCSGVCLCSEGCGGFAAISERGGGSGIVVAKVAEALSGSHVSHKLLRGLEATYGRSRNGERGSGKAVAGAGAGGRLGVAQSGLLTSEVRRGACTSAPD